MFTKRRSAILLPSLCVILAACVFPTDRSGELSVQLDDLPALFVDDVAQLTARLIDENGVVVPNGIVRFESSDTTVLRVSFEGLAVAAKSGTATVTASALAFTDATPASADATVRDLFQLDSIRPLQAAFGQIINLFGVGLNPDSLFIVTIGGVEAPVASFVPADTAFRNRLGRLSVWVPPPAPPSSGIFVLGIAGGKFFPESLGVIQRDLFEPNQNAPTDLGTLTNQFFNPALAFERISRTDSTVPVDWYTFTTTTTQDWTFVARPFGTARLRAFLTPAMRLTFAGGRESLYTLGSDTWGIGTNFRPCGGNSLYEPIDGFHFDPFELNADSAIVAVKNLPAGTYHLLLAYTEDAFSGFDPSFSFEYQIFVSGLGFFQTSPQPYGLLALPTYISELPPDAAEENDYCDVAAPISIPDTLNLTIDNPHDADWFSFTVSGAGQFVRFFTVASDEESDLDLYVVRKVPGDTITPLVAVDFGFAGGDSETTAGTFLDPGNYFLVVIDFLGRATNYQLGSDFSPAPPAPPASFQPSLGEGEKLHMRRRPFAGFPGRPDGM